jgi:probable rRNA maturation factor
VSIELEIEGDDSPAVREAALAALDAVGVDDGHLAIAFVRPEQIAALNQAHRGKEGPTDVLSFPVDGAGPLVVGPRELGDVVICREHATDVVEAVVHGVLHLCGHDHETDSGEMLELQDRIVAGLQR